MRGLLIYVRINISIFDKTIFLFSNSKPISVVIIWGVLRTSGYLLPTKWRSYQMTTSSIVSRKENNIFPVCDFPRDRLEGDKLFL